MDAPPVNFRQHAPFYQIPSSSLFCVCTVLTLFVYSFLFIGMNQPLFVTTKSTLIYCHHHFLIHFNKSSLAVICIRIDVKQLFLLGAHIEGISPTGTHRSRFRVLLRPYSCHSIRCHVVPSIWNVSSYPRVD